MPKIKTEADTAITIAEMHFQTWRCNLVGTSPLVPHAVSHKGRGSLLFPSPRKNAAEKAASMKHDPFQEFIDAAYQFTDDDRAPTRLYMPASAFHSAMASAAIDIAGARKAVIGRLTKVIGPFGARIPVYGIPKV